VSGACSASAAPVLLMGASAVALSSSPPLPPNRPPPPPEQPGDRCQQATQQIAATCAAQQARDGCEQATTGGIAEQAPTQQPTQQAVVAAGRAGEQVVHAVGEEIDLGVERGNERLRRALAQQRIEQAAEQPARRAGDIGHQAVHRIERIRRVGHEALAEQRRQQRVAGGGNGGHEVVHRLQHAFQPQAGQHRAVERIGQVVNQAGRRIEQAARARRRGAAMAAEQPFQHTGQPVDQAAAVRAHAQQPAQQVTGQQVVDAIGQVVDLVVQRRDQRGRGTLPQQRIEQPAQQAAHAIRELGGQRVDRVERVGVVGLEVVTQQRG